MKILTAFISLLSAVSCFAGSFYGDIERQLRREILPENKEYVITIPYAIATTPQKYDSLRVELLGDTQPLGSCWVKVYFYQNGDLFQSVSLNIQIALYEYVLVTRTIVKKDETFSPDQVELARREIANYSDPPVINLNDLAGMCASRALPEGKMITRSMLAPEILIKRGDAVTIEYQKGNMKVTASGEAKQAGSRGELIKVRNLASNKTITAEVQDEQSVKVLR